VAEDVGEVDAVQVGGAVQVEDEKAHVKAIPRVDGTAPVLVASGQCGVAGMVWRWIRAIVWLELMGIPVRAMAVRRVLPQVGWPCQAIVVD
jgi:coenzyme F420-reducing hydrogenase gamma subunit